MTDLLGPERDSLGS